MDLVIHEVVELEHIEEAHRRLLVEWFAGTPVVELCFAAERDPRQELPGIAGPGARGFELVETTRHMVVCLFDRSEHLRLVCAVEDGSDGLVAQDLGRPAEVRLQDLADIHP